MAVGQQSKGEREGAGRAGTALSGVLFEEGGESASSFTPFLQWAAASGDTL